ncbi:MAG TPA: NAD(P)/FAD-dependent oxidoreductase [Candidatus Binatia bacterium]|jgi:protoporphyrinogen oxidase|nr:NAD(P)/FAD-dependent oxidoreductase [Candidatus Binatia bacterium]
MMSNSPVLIIGAGPAGLTAAYELTKLGLRAVILEADGQVGGLARTVNYRGYRFDIGGHRFFSKVPLINALWQEILGEDFLIRPRLSRIHYDGRFFAYPLKVLDALAGLGPVEALLVGLSYTKARLFPGKEETNFAQWVSNRFGDRLYQIFFKTYTEKVWGIPCTEISADWAVQRIRNLSLSEALRNALLGAQRAKDGRVITTLIDSFHYPCYGPGMMWERCEELLAERGSVTLRDVHIDRIRHRHGRTESICGRTPTGERVEYGGEHFISTMPLHDLVHALDPAPPAEVIRAANRLRYRDYLTVVLIVRRAAVFPDNWLYIHSPEVKVGRIQNYKNWSPAMVPDPSRTSLGLEYFLWDKDEEWNWPQQRLIEVGIQECARIGLITADEVEDGTVVRMRKAYPVYDQHYHHSVATVRHYLESLANLQTIGRNGLHRYNNQDHSMLTGVYAARNLAGERYDVWSVNTEMEYHEEGQAAEERAGDRLVPVRLTPTGTDRTPSPDEIIAAVFAELDPVALGGAIGMVGGIVLFLMAAVLLLKGGGEVGPNLSLLRYYLPGFAVTWKGALVGCVEAGVGGFTLGYLGACLRNWGMAAYAALLQRRAEARARRNLLDKV